MPGLCTASVRVVIHSGRSTSSGSDYTTASQDKIICHGENVGTSPEQWGYGEPTQNFDPFAYFANCMDSSYLIIPFPADSHLE